MIEAAEAAARFAEGRTRSDLDRDPILAFALVRAIEIVEEAASKISVETRGLTPDIPWSSIVSMRNRLVPDRAGPVCQGRGAQRPGRRRAASGRHRADQVVAMA